MKSTDSRTAGLLLALTVMALRGAAGEPATVGHIEPAQLLKKPDPRDFNFMGKQDSYFVLRLTIGTTGHVRQVDVTDRGFAKRELLYVAGRYAKAITFKPATNDGVPIESSVLLPFRFEGGATERISSKYREQEKKVAELLRAGDYAGADFHAEWMLSEVVKTRYEYVALQGTLVDVNFTNGNYARALEAAESASQRVVPAPEFALHQKVPKNSPNNYVANNPPEYIKTLLDLKLQAASRQGLVLEALKTYYELAGLIEMKPEDPRVAFAVKVTALLESDAPLAGKMRLGKNGNADHELFRRNFTLTNVQGNIQTISLTCQGQLRELEYKPDVEWAVPKNWGNCNLSVVGDPDASFNIVEFADRASAPPPQ